MAEGVFCRAGDGALRLEDLTHALRAAGYDGYATLEQDRRPQSPGTPLDDLRQASPGAGLRNR